MFGNIDALLKLRKAWGAFAAGHPGVAGFLAEAEKKDLGADTVIELKLSYPDGTTLETSMKVRPEDIELMSGLKELMNRKV